MGFIYKISNKINDKIYIGKTSRSVEVRFNEHINDSFNKNSPSYNYYLHSAIRKYGIKNFVCETIEEVEENQINDREVFWISQYDSYNTGYNLTLGGEGRVIYQDTDILKFWREGYSQKEITEILGITHGNISSRLSILGISEEEKRVRGREKTVEKNSDPVLQFTKDGIFIKEWPSASAIERETGMSRSNIKSACNGKLKSAYGFIWKRKNRYGPQRKKGG